ncbi:MAG: hypothetical protein DRI57_16010 [Deltaproteobacteria bacterium]|nr:MAG: hypothetical protein DRI57_16010 [Deltaproteobacteria bacterium]
MKKAIVFTVFVLFSLLNVGTLIAADWTDGTGGSIYYNGGNVGIGKTIPETKLHVYSENGAGAIISQGSLSSGTEDWFEPDYPTLSVIRHASRKGANIALGNQDDNFYPYGSHASFMIYNPSKELIFRINADDGNVGIRTSKPQSELAVNGTITAKEVVVTTEGWSDYVLKDDYKLMPLDELERSIEKNGHLPDIPSAEEVKKNGVSVGEMQAKLLQKIEELTLHVIEQNKKIGKLEQLQKENEVLRKRVASLQNTE